MNRYFYSISNECSIYRKRSVNTYLRRVFLRRVLSAYSLGPDPYKFDCELVVGFREGYEYGYILGVL